MAVSIIEALENAYYNLKNPTIEFQKDMGLRQLHNAIELLYKGYDIDTEVEPLLEEFGNVENVPNIN